MLAGGRSSEHEISLASARSVLEALDPERYDVVDCRDRPGRALGARLRRRRQRLGGRDAAGAQPTSVRRDARRRSTSCFPILHGPFGEDGTVQGLLELAGRAVRRRGRRRVGALHGQGPVQEGAPRQRDPRRAATSTLREGDAVENPFGYPGLRQAGAARLVGRHLEGARRGGARGGRRARVPARREGAGRGVRRRRRGRGRRPRQPRADRVAPGRDRPARARVVRLRVEVRRGRDGARRSARTCRGDGRAGPASSRSRRSSRPSARGWRASTASSARTAASSSTS